MQYIYLMESNGTCRKFIPSTKIQIYMQTWSFTLYTLLVSAIRNRAMCYKHPLLHGDCRLLFVIKFSHRQDKSVCLSFHDIFFKLSIWYHVSIVSYTRTMYTTQPSIQIHFELICLLWRVWNVKCYVIWILLLLWKLIYWSEEQIQS